MTAYAPGDLSKLLNPHLGVPEDVKVANETATEEKKAAVPTEGKKKKVKTTKKDVSVAPKKNTKKKVKTKKATPEPKAKSSPESAEAGAKPDKKKTTKKNKRKLDSSEPSVKADAAATEGAGTGEAASERQAKKQKKGPKKNEINAEKVKLSQERHKEFLKGTDHHADDPRNSRTIFVGNVPVTIKTKELFKIFSDYGAVESVRLRSFGQGDPKISKRAAFATKSFHESRETCNAYVVFEEDADAAKALAHNGKQIRGQTVRVDSVSSSTAHDNTRSVFVGNLPFNVKEEDVRELFEDCGVEAVRLVRDRATSVGKGFGFVLLKDAKSVRQALTFDKAIFSERPLRVFKAVDKPKQTAATKKVQAKFVAKQLSGAAKRLDKGKKRKQASGGSSGWQGEMVSASQNNSTKKKKHADRGKLFRGKPKEGAAPRKPKSQKQTPAKKKSTKKKSSKKK